MCTIKLTALKFKAGESAKTDHKMRRPAHVQTELSEDIAMQTRRMTKLPPNALQEIHRCGMTMGYGIIHKVLLLGTEAPR